MNGILLINKPKEYTSHDIVAIVKKIYKEKVGHTGTLDPNATGVLPLLIGKATLVSKYLINHDKTYIAILKFGIKTDTADGEGAVIEEQECNAEILNKNNIERVFHQLIGKRKQCPPMYSAIKVKGKKLYEYARKGEKIHIEPRTIEIYNLKLINLDIEKKEMKFEVKCSKGTYIRSLCEEIANALGTIGYMKELERTKVGEFSINQTTNLENLEQHSEDQNYLNAKLITIEKIFEERESIEISDKELVLFLNGVKLSKAKTNHIYRIYNKKQFIGIGIVEDNKLKRDIVI